MYLQKVVIENIKSIHHIEMDFKKPAGWHVLIGDNGSGKSSIIRSVALALVGPEQALGLRADWGDWLNRNSETGRIKLSLKVSPGDQRANIPGKASSNVLIPNELEFRRSNGSVALSTPAIRQASKDPWNHNWGERKGWFSVAYGPYRRFVGGNPEWTKVFYSLPRLGAHLSAFGEDVALTEAIDWLVKLNYELLEKKSSGQILHDIKTFVNSPDFLPHGVKIDSVSSEGVKFVDGYGSKIHVNQMSDGYRSILSLTFELIRQLIRVYGDNAVFKNIRRQNMIIDLSGVVLIDEIDAHLHPTWQTRIGKWFTQYFPNIQFIVTTHSPLVCRASDKGTIWRLAAPGSSMPSGEVIGIERERLIYGNVLDAYGTEIFGSQVSVNLDSVDMKEELVRLSKLKMAGRTTEKENSRFNELKSTFSTDDSLEL
ncbi:MAG: AAA family ATPase [Bacteroidales bacterium]|nr:AAA family ATPase [Bacteroidales bacterium]